MRLGYGGWNNKFIGNEFGEFCCNATPQLQILCAHNGCSAKVHPWCQWAWLNKAQLRDVVRSPAYCPAHNIQRGDYIRQYYESHRRTIPPDVLVLLASNPSNADTSDINASVEPGVRRAQQSAALMGPGVREHERAQRAVAGGETVVLEHASAQQAAAREDIAGTSMSMNSSNEDPEEWDRAICPEPIDLNDCSSIMRTQCNHFFYRTCLEKWMLVKVRFLIWFSNDGGYTFCLPNNNL